MHADTIYSDLAIKEFLREADELFKPHRREMSLLQSQIIEAVINHKCRNELQRRLVLLTSSQLVRECREDLATTQALESRLVIEGSR